MQRHRLLARRLPFQSDMLQIRDQSSISVTNTRAKRRYVQNMSLLSFNRCDLKERLRLRLAGMTSFNASDRRWERIEDEIDPHLDIEDVAHRLVSPR